MVHSAVKGHTLTLQLILSLLMLHLTIWNLSFLSNSQLFLSLQQSYHQSPEACRWKPDPHVLSQLHNSASGAMMMGLELVKTAAGGGGDKPGQWRGPLVSIMCPGHCAAKPLCQPEKHDIDWERLHRGRQVASRSYFYGELCMMLIVDVSKN